MILATSDSGIYEGYVDMYKTNVGYDSKSQFAKQYEYSTSKEAEVASSNKSNSSGVAGTKMVSSKDEISNWGGNYADFAGNTVEIDGLVYKCGNKGPAMPLFLQGHDNSWSAADVYPGGSTHPIANSGCGYTSTAMAITYLIGHFVSPAEMTQKAGGKYHVNGSGIDHGSFLPWIASQYGLQFKAVGFSEFKQGLQEGKVGIVNTAFKDTAGEAWSKSGHVIAVRGLTEDGKFLVNNPNARGEAQLNREWADAEMQRNCGVYYLLWK